MGSMTTRLSAFRAPRGKSCKALSDNPLPEGMTVPRAARGLRRCSSAERATTGEDGVELLALPEMHPPRVGEIVGRRGILAGLSRTGNTAP